MRILIVNYEYPPIGGGAGVVTENLCSAIADMNKDIQMDLFTGNNECLKQKSPSFFGKIYTVPVKRDSIHSLGIMGFITFLFYGLLSLRKILKNEKYDLIHYHCSIPSGLLAFIHFFSIPYIITQHGVDVPFFIRNENIIFQILLLPLNFLIFNRAKNVICVSERLAEQQRNFFLQKEKVTTIHNAVDTNFWKFKKKENLGDEIILTYVGRFDYSKRIDRIIDFAMFLKENGINFHIHLIGTGKLFAKYTSLITHRGLNNECTLHGLQSKEFIREQLYSSHFFISLSDYESFGLSTMEAISTGTPVIISNKAGLSDFVTENSFGVALDFQDITNTFMESLFYLQKTTNYYDELTSASHIKEKIKPWSTIAQSYITYYKSYAR